MTDLNDQHLDALLRGHFDARLNPQLGRAERAFAGRLAEEARFGPDAGPFPIRPRARLFSGRTLAFVGTAMAAAVAAIVVGPAFTPQPTQPGTFSGRPVVGLPTTIEPQMVANNFVVHPSDRAPLMTYTHSQTVDEGMVNDGDGPARQLRHQTLQRTEWQDQDGKVRMELIVPREDVMRMKMDTY